MYKIILGITLLIIFVNSEQFSLTYLCEVQDTNCSAYKQIKNITSKSKAKVNTLQSIKDGSVGFGKCKDIRVEDIKCSKTHGSIEIHTTNREDNQTDNFLRFFLK